MWQSELWVLFSSSFMSATFLPGASEVNVLYLVHESNIALSTLVGVATAGNTLGGFTNYLLGLLAAKGVRSRYFERENLQRSLENIRRYGALCLLFAWLPVVGDPLCLAAGYLRINAWLSLLCMALGKLARYTFLVFVASQLS